jgi:uncharacterized membrane protein
LVFFLSLAGIIVSAIVLHYAHGHEGWLAGGVVGLVASILVLIVCVAIFVIAVVTLALRMRRVRTKISKLANSDNLAIMRSATHQIDADMFGINNRRDNNRDERLE